MDFWREFLDEMAGHRFNVLSLWSLHPFPSIVKVPEYPDIALDDVIGTTLKFDDTFSTMGKDMLRPAMLEHLSSSAPHLDDRAQRRHLQLPMGRPRILLAASEHASRIIPASSMTSAISSRGKACRGRA